MRMRQTTFSGGDRVAAHDPGLVWSRVVMTDSRLCCLRELECACGRHAKFKFLAGLSC